MIILNIPRPPSTNKIYRNPSEKEIKRAWAQGKQPPQRIKTQRYEEWITAAGWDVLAARQKPIKGDVEIEILIGRDINQDGSPSRRRMDCSNFVKATEDLMVRHKLITDDSYIVKGSYEFTTDIEPRRVQVCIRPCRRLIQSEDAA